MRDIGHFIGGKQVKGTGRTADVFNPDTGEVRAKVALASKADVEQASDVRVFERSQNLPFMVETPED